MDHSFTIETMEARVYRVPIDEPVVTSFGEMKDRPAVFLRVVSTEGDIGWGEVWCNFPPVGAEYRARLFNATLAPLCTGRRFSGPGEAFNKLTAATHTLAVQSGEPGPLAQLIAGLDVALWDMVARRADMPLYRMFRDAAVGSVPAYASGINANLPEKLALSKREEGYRRFKLKVGFGRETDLRNLRAMREALGDETPIMIDANQAWDFETALEMQETLAAHGPLWLEEPMRADEPLEKWSALCERSAIPIALGENLRGLDVFRTFIGKSGIAFIQPDIGKWGGFTGCVEIGRHAADAGVVMCPHWLGGGIGLAASFHLLAAVGGSGILEVDVNQNPLRDTLVMGFPGISADGTMAIPNGGGLGVEPDVEALEAWRIVL